MCTPWLRSLIVWGMLASGATAAAPPTPWVDSFGDPLPAGAVARLGTVRWRHPGCVAFAFGRAEETFLSADATGINVWETKTGKILRRMPAKIEFLNQLPLTPDGSRLVAGSGAAIVVYDAKTGREVWHIEAKARPWFSAVAMTPDGAAVVVGRDDGTIAFHETKAGKLLRTFKGKQGVRWLEFSADGSVLATTEAAESHLRANDSACVTIWDVKTGKPGRTWEGKKLVGEIALSPDGKQLASNGWAEVRLYDVAGGERQPALVIGNERPDNVAFSPDGRLAVGFPQGVQLWEVREKRLLRDVAPGRGFPRPAFSRDGRLLAFQSGYGIALMDVKTGQRHVEPSSACSEITNLAVSKDGRLVAGTTSVAEVLLWDARTGRQTGRPLALAKSVLRYRMSFSDDGTVLAGFQLREIGERRYDQEFWTWDVKRSRALRPTEALGEAAQGSFDPRGRSVAIFNGKTISLRDLKTGKVGRLITVRRHDTGKLDFTQCIFSPDGNTLAVCQNFKDRNSAVALWDLSQEGVVRHVDADRFAGVFSFGVHGRRLLKKNLHAEKVVSVWDLWQGELPRSLTSPPVAGDGWVGHSFSPNGTWIAFLGDENGEKAYVKLVEVMTGQVVLDWRGDPTLAGASAWAPDGRRLAIATAPPLVLDLPLCASAPASAGLSPAKLGAALWADLADKDAAVAFRAICWLASNPDQGLPLLEKSLCPIAKPDLAPIRRLIAQLDDDDFDVRQSAEAKLKTMVRAPKRLLEAAVADKNNSLEQRVRARRLLAAMRVPEPTTEDLRQLRGLQALEWIASPRARRHVRALADGDPDAPLTRYAAQVAGRP